MVNVELWGMRGSTCTDRDLFTANELNVPIDFHPIDGSKQEQKSEEHLRRQPFGKVPAAEVDGQPMYESRAIARAVARSTPAGEQLFPSSDLKKVAVFEQWASLEQGTITPVVEKVVGERVFSKYHGRSADEAVVKKAMEDGQKAFEVLDKQLSSNEWVTGEFSLVDIFLSTYFALFVHLPEGKQAMEQYPHIAAWQQRVSSRPAWQKVVADRQQK